MTYNDLYDAMDYYYHAILSMWTLQKNHGTKSSISVVIVGTI